MIKRRINLLFLLIRGRRHAGAVVAAQNARRYASEAAQVQCYYLKKH